MKLMYKFEVKRASESDVQILADILTEASKRKTEYGDFAWGTEPYLRKEVLHYINADPTYLFYIDKKEVATISFSKQDELWDKQNDDALYIHRLAVINGYEGLGAEIIEWAKSLARQEDIKYLRLDCDIENKKLCNYYERLGFTKVNCKTVVDKNYTAALYQLLV